MHIDCNAEMIYECTSYKARNTLIHIFVTESCKKIYNSSFSSFSLSILSSKATTVSVDQDLQKSQ